MCIFKDKLGTNKDAANEIIKELSANKIDNEVEYNVNLFTSLKSRIIGLLTRVKNKRNSHGIQSSKLGKGILYNDIVLPMSEFIYIYKQHNNEYSVDNVDKNLWKIEKNKNK